MKEKNVLKYYVLCNKLKDIVRTGWIAWNVKRDRIESIAEHIFGVQMLAIAMQSEYQYDIDLQKVILMLAVHELEEIYIGDLTLFQISREEKEKLGHEAITKLLSSLLNGEQIKNLIMEFDARTTAEAKFAYYCDKLECDIQCKLYDEENCVDLTNQDNNTIFKNVEVQKLQTTEKTWSRMWLTFSQNKYNYDQNFTAVSNYVKNNNLKDLID